MIIKRQARKEKKNYHLWGIHCDHMSSWHYIRPCAPDQRALIKINTKLYSQLEIREEGTGRTVKIFAFNVPDHREA
ncbi:MAG: hypothetical protein CMI54_04960 [Parcubacteria group bacterium]|nr:hypothetical protein [Parcubacteria group bacterium]|tara:strand:+ start:380 stop:607 length:228 start_codon:yes stop_codon:yes gene_type:complete